MLLPRLLFSGSQGLFLGVSRCGRKQSGDALRLPLVKVSGNHRFFLDFAADNWCHNDLATDGKNKVSSAGAADAIPHLLCCRLWASRVMIGAGASSDHYFC